MARAAAEAAPLRLARIRARRPALGARGRGGRGAATRTSRPLLMESDRGGAAPRLLADARGHLGRLRRDPRARRNAPEPRRLGPARVERRRVPPPPREPLRAPPDSIV